MPADPEFLFDGPADATRTIAMAHGAGAGMDSPFMAFFTDGFGRRGFRVARFEFPYMRASAPAIFALFQALLASAQFNGKVKKLICCRRLADLDARTGAGLDEPVAKKPHPAMAVLAQQFLECVAPEALGPDASPDANVGDEQRRVEASAAFAKPRTKG